MKKLGFTLLLICQLINSFSQNAHELYIDTLLNRLDTSKNTLIQFQTLLDLSNEHLSFDNEKSLVFVNQAFDLAKSLSQKELNSARARKATTYQYLKKPKKFLPLLDTVIRESQNTEDLTRAHTTLGIYYSDINVNDSSMLHSHKALYYAEKDNLEKYLSNTYGNLGIEYWKIGKLDEADSLYKLALSVAEKINSSHQIASTTFNLGLLNFGMGKYEAALEYYLRAYEENKKRNVHVTELLILSQLGKISFLSNDTTEAFNYLKKGHQLIQEHKIAGESSCQLYYDLTRTYLDMNKLDSAMTFANFLSGAGELFESYEDRQLANSLKALLFAKMDDSNQSNKLTNYLFAEKDKIKSTYFNVDIYAFLIESLHLNDQNKKALQIIPDYKEMTKGKGLGISRDFHLLEYKINKANGNYKEALTAHEYLKSTNDSFLLATNRQTLVDARIKFESGEKELKNVQLSERNDLIAKSNRQLGWGLGILGLLSAGLIWLYASKRKASKLIENQNFELAELNNTKDRLFAIISHDLRNEVSAFQNLNNIFGYHLKAGNYDRLETLTQQVDKSAVTVNTLMDNLLTWSSSQLKGIELHPEKIKLNQSAQAIIDIFEQFAKTKEVKLTTNVDADTTVFADPDSFQFILRNIISNSLKYTPQGGSVDVSASESSEGIAIKVSDTGKGMSVEKLKSIWTVSKKSSAPGTQGERGAGIGLSLVKDFVDRNMGQIHIESSAGNGTTVTIILPKAS